jgi:NADPH2:quinone reductase
MKVCLVTEAGGPHVLETIDRPDPEPGPGEVVVAMAAANVNPTDVGARQGMFPPGFEIDGPPYVLGWDLAGEIVALGEGVDGRAVGDRVVGMIPWYHSGGRYGAYAERVLLRSEWLVDLPTGLDPVQAATVPLNALTAEQALAKLGAPDDAELLITGASGAVGSFAVQLAVARGLEVTALAGTGDEEWVTSLGPSRVLARDTPLDSIGAFAFVLDAVPLGAAVFPAVADGGTIVSTRPVQDDPGREISQVPMLIESDPAALQELVRSVAAGELRTRVAETVPLSQAADAHRRAEQTGRRGKIVLVSDESGRG